MLSDNVIWIVACASAPLALGFVFVFKIPCLMFVKLFLFLQILKEDTSVHHVMSS